MPIRTVGKRTYEFSNSGLCSHIFVGYVLWLHFVALLSHLPSVIICCHMPLYLINFAHRIY